MSSDAYDQAMAIASAGLVRAQGAVVKLNAEMASIEAEMADVLQLMADERKHIELAELEEEVSRDAGDAFVCPLSFSVMSDPVVASDGHTVKHALWLTPMPTHAYRERVRTHTLTVTH